MADRCLLYYITDRSQFPGDESARRHAVLAKIEEAAAAGVDYIQLREKDLSARDLEMLARDALAVVRNNPRLRAGNRELRTRVLINSRTDIALAVGADGVHLRTHDVAPHEIRHMLEISALRPLATDHFLISMSCHSAAGVVAAEAEKVDFAVFAPVFGKSGGSTQTPPAGLDALQKACQTRISVLALGGVSIENAALCLKAGAAGVA